MAEFSGLFAAPKQKELLIDSSKGAASRWVASFLTRAGIKSREVSLDAIALNHNCGAGELKPTDSWTWEEAANSEHILIRSLNKCDSGIIIAAALDGDGDRCLLIESTEDGCRVVDGDEMADHVLRSAKGDWHLAASIESDLSLISSLERLPANIQFTQTAVGDRWLSNALRESSNQVIGVEDSGHLVMSAPHPSGGRCLVGDGVASMLAVLCAMSCEDRCSQFVRGFKKSCLLYTSPSPRDATLSRMPSSA